MRFSGTASRHGGVAHLILNGKMKRSTAGAASNGRGVGRVHRDGVARPLRARRARADAGAHRRQLCKELPGRGDEALGAAAELEVARLEARLREVRRGRAQSIGIAALRGGSGVRLVGECERSNQAHCALRGTSDSELDLTPLTPLLTCTPASPTCFLASVAHPPP